MPEERIPLPRRCEGLKPEYELKYVTITLWRWPSPARRSWDNPITKVILLRFGRCGNHRSIPSWDKASTMSTPALTPSQLLINRFQGPFPWGKAAISRGWTLTLVSTKVQNKWRHSSTPPCISWNVTYLSKSTIQINQPTRCNNFSSNKLEKLLNLVG